MSNAAVNVEATGDDVFLAFLATLYLKGLRVMDDAGEVVHESFAQALDAMHEFPERGHLFRRFRVGAFSGRIDALDKALIRAEQYGWVHFPNPSYERIVLAMSLGDSERLVERVPPETRSILEAGAEAFAEHFQNHSW